jgi:nuclease-like protein
MGPWIVKYDGPCSMCGTTLRAGTEAVWDRRLRKMHCIECPAEATPDSSPPPLEVGVAGGSARREYDRRQAKREAELKSRWGNRVGGWINRFADEPQSIRAWGLGAYGEELLGDALAAVEGLYILSDRRVRGTRGNIDHLVVAPAGVFVVDAKYMEGLVEVRNYGGLFRSERRLTVNRRNKSQLARNMSWQVDAVVEALNAHDLEVGCPVAPILCFVQARWPFFGAPTQFEGVYLESERSIVKRLALPVVHSPAESEYLAGILADEFPPK